jgi:hypothetical protein
LATSGAIASGQFKKGSDMITRMLVSGLLASAMFSASAVALAAAGEHGPMAPRLGYPHQGPMKTAAERCTALEEQLDSAIESHGSSGLISEAKSLRSEGAKLCNDGRHIEGIGKLESALWDLGVTPKS